MDNMFVAFYLQSEMVLVNKDFFITTNLLIVNSRTDDGEGYNVVGCRYRNNYGQPAYEVFEKPLTVCLLPSNVISTQLLDDDSLPSVFKNDKSDKETA